MGLFDELKGDDALAPGKGAELALRRELADRRERWSKPGYFYRGAADLMLQHGRYFQGRELPDEWAHLRGGPNLCFLNAMEAARDHGLRYFEGVYATSGHFTTHAWVVTAANELLEVTYPTDPDELADGWDLQYGPVLPPEHWGYWGVEFRWELVFWHGQDLGLPMLDRSHMDAKMAWHLDMRESHDYPILKVPYDLTRTSL